MSLMKQILRLASISAVLVAAATTSASAADKETRQLMADVRMLQEQTQLLQTMLGSLNEALKALNTRLDEQTEANRKAFADQKLVVDNLSNDLRVVREKVDDSNVRIGSLSQEVEALRQGVQDLNSSRPPAFDPLAGGAADGSSGSVPAAGGGAVGVSPQRLWDEAMALYTAGQYDLAAVGFESYIKTFPKSDKADDAQVYVANSYLQDGKNDKAVEASDQAIRMYPTGDAIPEAYYRKGLALKNLRQIDRARQAFELLIKNYPTSYAATLAMQQVQQLMKP
jgi:TolA-binding protein